jgi:hypothetical protein
MLAFLLVCLHTFPLICLLIRLLVSLVVCTIANQACLPAYLSTHLPSDTRFLDGLVDSSLDEIWDER